MKINSDSDSPSSTENASEHSRVRRDRQRSFSSELLWNAQIPPQPFDSRICIIFQKVTKDFLWKYSNPFHKCHYTLLGIYMSDQHKVFHLVFYFRYQSKYKCQSSFFNFSCTSFCITLQYFVLCFNFLLCCFLHLKGYLYSIICLVSNSTLENSHHHKDKEHIRQARENIVNKFKAELG